MREAAEATKSWTATVTATTAMLEEPQREEAAAKGGGYTLGGPPTR